MNIRALNDKISTVNINKSAVKSRDTKADTFSNIIAQNTFNFVKNKKFLENMDISKVIKSSLSPNRTLVNLSKNENNHDCKTSKNYKDENNKEIERISTPKSSTSSNTPAMINRKSKYSILSNFRQTRKSIEKIPEQINNILNKSKTMGIKTIELDKNDDDEKKLNNHLNPKTLLRDTSEIRISKTPGKIGIQIIDKESSFYENKNNISLNINNNINNNFEILNISKDALSELAKNSFGDLGKNKNIFKTIADDKKSRRISSNIQSSNLEIDPAIDKERKRTSFCIGNYFVDLKNKTIINNSENNCYNNLNNIGQKDLEVIGDRNSKITNNLIDNNKFANNDQNYRKNNDNKNLNLSPNQSQNLLKNSSSNNKILDCSIQPKCTNIKDLNDEKIPFNNSNKGLLEKLKKVQNIFKIKNHFEKEKNQPNKNITNDIKIYNQNNKSIINNSLKDFDREKPIDYEDSEKTEILKIEKLRKSISNKQMMNNTTSGYLNAGNNNNFDKSNYKQSECENIKDNSFKNNELNKSKYSNLKSNQITNKVELNKQTNDFVKNYSIDESKINPKIEMNKTTGMKKSVVFKESIESEIKEYDNTKIKKDQKPVNEIKELNENDSNVPCKSSNNKRERNICLNRSIKNDNKSINENDKSFTSCQINLLNNFNENSSNNNSLRSRNTIIDLNGNQNEGDIKNRIIEYNNNKKELYKTAFENLQRKNSNSFAKNDYTIKRDSSYVPIIKVNIVQWIIYIE